MCGGQVPRSHGGRLVGILAARFSTAPHIGLGLILLDQLRIVVQRQDVLGVHSRQRAGPVVGQGQRPFRADETVHFAPVVGYMGGLPAMVQVMRDRGGAQVKGRIALCPVRFVGKFHVLGNAIRSGKRPEVMVKGDVFLDDIDEVLDRNITRVLRQDDHGREPQRGQEHGWIFC